MAPSPDSRRIQDVRRFNRFYTRQIGLLNQGLAGSAFSLTEVRVLYELAHRDGLTASELRAELGLDAGYLSRILRAFTARGFVKGKRSTTDARRTHLALTPRGRAEFRKLDRRTNAEVRTLLEGLGEHELVRVTGAMDAIERSLGAARPAAEPYTLRPHRPGDIGWIIHRHGVLYWREYGWDERFEALVAEILARFINEFVPGKEYCWVAERHAGIVGCVFCVRQDDEVAKLRCLLVEPAARGLGLGGRLVRECIAFARAAGYRKLTLWTNDVLVSARRIYQGEGFTLVREEKHRSFGHDLVGQNWELRL